MIEDRRDRGRLRLGRPRLIVLAASALLIVGLDALAAGAVVQGSLFDSRAGTATLAERTLAGSHLDLSTDGGAVGVHTWGKPGIHVTAIEQGGRRGDTVEVALVGATVRVRQRLASCFVFCARSLRYEVSAPARTTTEIRAASGNVAVDGVGGGVTVGTASGNVSLHGIGGRLNATTSSGNVELDAGHVTTAAVRTESGNVELAGVAGSLDLHSASGNVIVHNARDSVLDIATTSGDIDYSGSLASRGMDTLDSTSGNVALRLPPDSRFRLDAGAATGMLHDGFGLRDKRESDTRLSGTAGDGTARMRIRTVSGDITIARR